MSTETDWLTIMFVGFVIITTIGAMTGIGI